MNPKFFRNGIVMLVLVVGTAALLFTWITSSSPTQTTGYSEFLANVSAGERNAYDGGNEIGLDVDTQVDIGTLSTIRELMTQTESMLASGRGNFNRMTNELAAINAGRGIGTTCE